MIFAGQQVSMDAAVVSGSVGREVVIESSPNVVVVVVVVTYMRSSSKAFCRYFSSSRCES